MPDGMPDMTPDPDLAKLNQTITIKTELFGTAMAVRLDMQPGIEDDYEEAEFAVKTLIAVLSQYLPEAVAESYRIPDNLRIGQIDSNEDIPNE